MRVASRFHDQYSCIQVYTMRDLNPMHFFRGPAPEAKPDASQASKDGMAGPKKPMTKVPSLLFDIEVGPKCGDRSLLHLEVFHPVNAY